MSKCEHKRLTNKHLTLNNSAWSCSDCGQPVPYPGGCSHRRIDNETWQCKECGERMVSCERETETVISAPNATPCHNPAHLAAMEAGEDFECHHPYTPDKTRERVVPIGIKSNYQCARCQYDGNYFSAHETIWDCGHSHRGDYVPVRGAAAVGG